MWQKKSRTFCFINVLSNERTKNFKVFYQTSLNFRAGLLYPTVAQVDKQGKNLRSHNVLSNVRTKFLALVCRLVDSIRW